MSCTHFRRLNKPLASAASFLTMLLLASGCWGKIVYVNKNAPGVTQDGTSWATAFLTIRSGINAAATGDEVWVAASTPAAPAYTESITLEQGVSLYGGFAGSETARSQRDWSAHATTVDGSGSNVMTCSTGGGVVDGFIVRNGNAGVYAIGGSLTVSHCNITGNTYGIFGSGFTVANSNIAGNSIGVSISGEASVVNCTITGNYRGVSLGVTTATVANCIIALNGVGIYTSAFTARPILSHNDVFGNSSANYVNLSDPTGMQGNISVDPLLSHPYHSIHIQPDSPCIDAGDSSFVQADWKDVDGQARIQRATVDIGADESDGSSWLVPSRVWYVSKSGNDANTGLSWAAARKTLSGALRDAAGLDEVWVALGNYNENISIPPAVGVYGGFSGTETARSQRDWLANVTTLTDIGSASAVVTSRYLMGCDLDGFTIRGSTSLYGVFGSLRVSNCTITGSAYGIDGYATVDHCTISGNAYGVGTPAAITDSIVRGNSSCGITSRSPNGSTITRCAVINNGVGIEISGGVAAVRDCVITGNGTGVSVYNTNPSTIVNCTITGGTYGVTVSYAGILSVTNSIVAFNLTGFDQDPLGSILELSHNDVFGNSASNFSNTVDVTGTDGNINADPVFVDFAAGNVRLAPGSPCVDAGGDSAVYIGDVDLDGKPRRIGAHVDMGAYEYGTSYYSVLDVIDALRFAAGLKAAPANTSWWTGSQTPSGVDIGDAVRLTRKATGLDANP